MLTAGLFDIKRGPVPLARGAGFVAGRTVSPMSRAPSPGGAPAAGRHPEVAHRRESGLYATTMTPGRRDPVRPAPVHEFARAR